MGSFDICCSEISAVGVVLAVLLLRPAISGELNADVSVLDRSDDDALVDANDGVLRTPCLSSSSDDAIVLKYSQ